MAQTKYDVASFLNNSSNPFTTFENVDKSSVKLNLPLFDTSFDVSKWASGILPDGTPIIKDTTKNKNNQEQEFSIPRVNNTEEISITPSISNTTSTNNYNLNVSFEDLLKQEGINARITSGYRENAKTSSGKTSHHATRGGAYDIVPTDGDFEKLRKEIYGNPRIIAWMKNKGWGILEETNPDILKKTGGTGYHWHFGPDKIALENFNRNLA